MTRSTAAASARFRQRKLSTRQALQILREDQVEKVDDEAQRNVPKVETGVEKGEEIVCIFCDRGFSCLVIRTRPPYRERRLTDAPCRNTTCKLPFLHPMPQQLVEKSLRYTFQHQTQFRARLNMNGSIRSHFHSQQHTSASLPRWKTAVDVLTISLMRTMYS